MEYLASISFSLFPTNLPSITLLVNDTSGREALVPQSARALVLRDTLPRLQEQPLGTEAPLHAAGVVSSRRDEGEGAARLGVGSAGLVQFAFGAGHGWKKESTLGRLYDYAFFTTMTLSAI